VFFFHSVKRLLLGIVPKNKKLTKIYKEIQFNVKRFKVEPVFITAAHFVLFAK
jgi:hypothetical protein